MKTIFYLILTWVIIGCGGAGGSTNGSSSTISDSSNENPIIITDTHQTSDAISTSTTGTDSVFVGYDDTGSTALVQLLKYKIINDLQIDTDLALPHEFLNAEEFISEEMVSMEPFEISIGLLSSESKDSGKKLYDLGIHLKGPTITTETRPNFVLTYCIDVSGSMNDRTGNSSLSSKSKISLVKDGLKSTVKQLKSGDVVNIVLFSNSANAILQNYIYGESNEANLIKKIDSINASGITNLEAGLKESYEIASKYYDSEKKNRVVLITDAMANAGSTDPTLIANSIIINNKEGILLSGIGIGYDYKAAFLEELTDVGAGNQFLVATDEDAENIFSSGFLPLLMLAAKEMKVEIVYPQSLSPIASAAEQTTTTAAALKGINFSYNADQFYLERFKTALNTDVSEGEITINITYLDPITNSKKTLSKTFAIENILENETQNIKDALAMIFLTNFIKGTKTWEDIKWEFDHVLLGHSSSLYTEYKSLLYQFANESEIDTDAF